ncbi:MAG: copper amine oxidase N-terminal domain-containing protein [Syntrophomonadaceae bacterium]|nr:copper amine oxidase N-terminal domain-containing protein [Syntrophomonadaceae bacterium]
MRNERLMKMKKSLIVLLVLVSALLITSTSIFASQPLTINLNGTVVSAPSDTRIVNSQVMVPLRWAAEQLGVSSIEWEPEKRNVTIKTNQDLFKIKILASYINGLEPRSIDKEAEMWPLPEKVKTIDLPRLRDRQLVLNLAAGKEEPLMSPLTPVLTITLTYDNASYTDVYAVYSAENHNGHIYVPMDWLAELFYADVHYNEATNLLSIQAPDLKLIEQQIAAIEDILVPNTPEEAVKLWGRGEQTRSGALQYAALSTELRQQADKLIRESGWVTGFSSPWVGPMTIKEEKMLSDTAVEYTVTFPEVTSTPPHPIATEKMVVEKLAFAGKEGWFITEMPQSSGYGIIAGTYQNVLVALSDVQLFLPLPNDWTIERTKHGFDLKNALGNTIGSIDQQDGYYLPNHSETLSDQKITVSQGESHLLVLSRSYPAASGVAENWQEVHALLPFKEQIWIDLCVRVSPENDVEQLKTILEKAITGVVYYQPERPLPPTETGSGQPAESTEWEPTIYTTVNNLDGVSMTVKEGTASSTGLTVEFKNNSSSQCIYGEHYWLEKKINGSWYQVPVIIDGNYGFNDIGYNLAAGAKGEWAVDWNWLYGSLDTGEYRLVKDILDFRGPGEYDTYYLTGEFTI